ncbi:MAG TPA: PhzF family phenazine biosynthesis protein [Gammaproteobacteria bacterium]|jgi:PhzF family phenazine biosynthesis protein
MPEIYQVDAFTEAPFHGNPAAVCLLDEERDSEWMQAVAMEMNLSETAFVRPRDNGFELRWFSPATEVNLCGHATLASAHVLWEAGLLSADAEAKFDTRSGRLIARRHAQEIELDFPADPTTPLEDDAALHAILGQPVVSLRRGREDWLVELDSEAAVRDCRPDLARIAALPARGLIITARGSGRFDFVSRFFAPGIGVDEDPVTGAAHCTLAGYWAERLGKSAMVAWQASARGGRLGVRLAGDRVFLTGRAVTVMRGELTV